MLHVESDSIPQLHIESHMIQFRSLCYRFQTNVEGLYNVIRLGVGLMGKNTDVDRWNGRGTIINTVPALSSNGSIASHALNACVLGMEQPLAADLGVEAIRVVSVVHDAKNSTDSASQDFARLAYLIATTPQINAATIPLCESVQ